MSSLYHLCRLCLVWAIIEVCIIFKKEKSQDFFLNAVTLVLVIDYWGSIYIDR